MAEYPVNKGIGRPVEFKGLKAQYLFVFAGGLLAAFLLFVILYMAGVSQWVCIGLGVTAASAVVWLTFRCNLQIFLCLFLEKLNMPQDTPVTKAS